MLFSLCRLAGFSKSSLDNSRGYIVKLTVLGIICLLSGGMQNAQAETNVPAAENAAATSGTERAAPAAPRTLPAKTILAFGDSLTAGYGLQKTEALPAQLEALFQNGGHPITFINAGVSGDTTAGGLRRLEWSLKKFNPDYVMLALGANDMLRAVDPRTTLQNLQQMMEILKAYNKPVLLVGMRAPASMGPAFSNGYDRMYASLAQNYGAVFYPFILEGVATNPALNLRDGVHPNAQGVAVMAHGMFPYVVQLMRK